MLIKCAKCCTTGAYGLIHLSPQVVVIGVASLPGSSVGELLVVVEAAALVSALEVLRHARRVLRKFVDPILLGGEEGVPVAQKLRRELHQTLQTLKGVARGHLKLKFSDGLQILG